MDSKKRKRGKSKETIRKIEEYFKKKEKNLKNDNTSPSKRHP